MLPGAFESTYTKPTTSYTSRKTIPANARGASTGNSRPEPAHWPLLWMLVLTQTAAGLFLACGLASIFKPQIFESVTSSLSIAGLALLIAGLTASIFHLGRLLGAWRVFLGLRRSWMSREIAAFALFVFSAVASIFYRTPTLAITTALLGLLSVFCSAMIYVDTRRPSWAPSLTFPKFFGATFLLGSSATASILSFLALTGDAEINSIAQTAAGLALAIRTALFSFEISNLKSAIHSPFNAFNLLFAVSTTCALLAIFNSTAAAAWFASLSFISTLSSQLLERYFFFTSSNAPRMPGTVA